MAQAIPAGQLVEICFRPNDEPQCLPLEILGCCEVVSERLVHYGSEPTIEFLITQELKGGAFLNSA